VSETSPNQIVRFRPGLAGSYDESAYHGAWYSPQERLSHHPVYSCGNLL